MRLLSLFLVVMILRPSNCTIVRRKNNSKKLIKPYALMETKLKTRAQNQVTPATGNKERSLSSSAWMDSRLVNFQNFLYRRNSNCVIDQFHRYIYWCALSFNLKSPEICKQ